MKITYFLPPKNPGIVWATYEKGEGSFLNDGDKSLTEAEIKNVEKQQDVLYAKKYPKNLLI